MDGLKENLKSMKSKNNDLLVTIIEDEDKGTFRHNSYADEELFVRNEDEDQEKSICEKNFKLLY